MQKKSRIDLVIIESEKYEKCIPLKTDDSLLALFFCCCYFASTSLIIKQAINEKNESNPWNVSVK